MHKVKSVLSQFDIDVKQKWDVGLIFVILFAIILRCYMACNHFTTCDDLGVAMSMSLGWDTTEGWSIKNCYLGFMSFWNSQWTYAPLQFLLTCVLIHPAMSYEQIIFWGRLPALLCSIASVIVMTVVITKIYKDNKWMRQLRFLGGLLVSICWNAIIHSAQMESYAIGFLASMLVILLLINNSKEVKPVRMALIIAALGYSQYQMFVFMACFYIVLFLKNLDFKKPFHKGMRNVILSGLLAVGLSIPNVVMFLKRGMLERGIAWNSGLEMQYVFDNTRMSFSYLGDFFINNILEYFRYLILPGKDGGLLVAILCIVLLLLSIIGLLTIHFDAKKRYLGWYIDLVYIIYAFMIFNGSLTLSPSRHMLVMVPITVITILQGLVGTFALINSLKNINRVFNICMGLGCCVIIGLFISGFGVEVKARQNRVSQDYLCELIEEKQPDIILTYRYAMDFYFMLPEGYTAIKEYYKNGLICHESLNLSELKEGTKIITWNPFRSQPEMALDFWERNIVRGGYLSDEWYLEEVNSSVVPWGGTQEYAEGMFDTGNYGEYITEYVLKRAE